MKLKCKGCGNMDKFCGFQQATGSHDCVVGLSREEAVPGCGSDDVAATAAAAPPCSEKLL